MITGMSAVDASPAIWSGTSTPLIPGMHDHGRDVTNSCVRQLARIRIAIGHGGS